MLTVGQLMQRKLATAPPQVNAVNTAPLMSNGKTERVFEEPDHRIIDIVTEPNCTREKREWIDEEPSPLSINTMMNKLVTGIDERRSITEAADLMQQHGMQHLLVFKAETVIGVLTARDLLCQVAVEEL